MISQGIMIEWKKSGTKQYVQYANVCVNKQKAGEGI